MQIAAERDRGHPVPFFGAEHCHAPACADVSIAGFVSPLLVPGVLPFSPRSWQGLERGFAIVVIGQWDRPIMKS